MEVRVGEAEELEGEGLVVGGGDGRREGDGREAVEGDGGVCGGDAGDEWGGGACVIGRIDDEDGDGETVADEELAELDH